MKVAIVGPAYPLRGGIANFNETLANAFLKAGHQSEIFSFSLQYPKILFPGKTQYVTHNNAPNVTIHNTINAINPFTWYKTAKQILSYQPDFVIIRYWMPFMAPALGVIARQLTKRNITVLALTDNIIPHEHRIGDKALTNYFVKPIKGFIVMSKSVGEELKQFTKQPSVYLPHPIYDIFGERVKKEEALKKLKLDANYDYLLFFGLVRAYKGLDLIIKALPHIKNDKIKLIVAGEFYDDKNQYDHLVKELGIEDKVIINNQFITDNDVKYYFSVADMVVQPYKTATQSGVTQIAYSFNSPMLVTNVGGLPEIVPHKKCGYVTSQSPSDIAHAINHFYNNNNYTLFSKNVEKEKERFSWNNMVNGIIKLYNQVK